MQANKLPQPNRTSPTQGLCGEVVGQRRNEYERRKVMDLIVDIYNNMNDEDKAGFTLEAAKEMVKDQIEIDFSQGRWPLEYDPQLFYEVIREFIEQDAEDGE